MAIVVGFAPACPSAMPMRGGSSSSSRRLSPLLVLWLVLATSLPAGLCQDQQEEAAAVDVSSAAAATTGDDAATVVSDPGDLDGSNTDLLQDQQQNGNETEAAALDVVIIPNTTFSRITNPQFAVNYSKPLCRVAEPEFLSEAVPAFARVDTEQARKTLQKMEVNQLQR